MTTDGAAGGLVLRAVPGVAARPLADSLVAAWTDSHAGLPVVSAGDPSSYREYTVRLGVRLSDGGTRVLF